VTHIEVERSKVKVTRPLNAVTENQPYFCNEKAGLSAFLAIHHQTQSIMRWYSRVQACNVAKQR